MTKWIAVLTDPLGLAGFALFLAFGLLGRRTAGSQARWLPGTCLAMAAVALLGGLTLGFVRQSGDGKARTSGGAMDRVVQGPQSTAVSGITGAVTIINNDNRVVTAPIASPPPAPAARAAPADCSRASALSEAPVTLTFVNQSRRAVELSWVGYDGAEKVYAVLEAGQTKIQPTYTNHSWCMRDRDSRVAVGFAIAPVTSSKIVIQ